MRPGQNKRMRGRNNNNNNNGGNRKGPNPLTRSYESNGPDVKIRGNAHHIAEKYLQLARDAQSSGDPVGAESYLQHAEHYFRLIATYQQVQQAGYNRATDDADLDGDDEDSGIPDRFASPQPPVPFVPQPQPQPQPYVGDRQAPPYGERPQGGDRPPYQQQDRNGYDRSQRTDRNGPDRNGQRRPFRDEGRGGEARNGEFRPVNDRRNGYDRMQERAQQQERFIAERLPRDQPSEQPRDPTDSGEQTRVDLPIAPPEMPVRPEVVAARAAEPAGRHPVDEAPGLPSFITTPTRALSSSPAPAEAEAAPVAAFPGDGMAEPPKFPRRRRRTTRAAVDEAPATADQPTGD